MEAPEELDREYNHIMEQSFQLKKHGELSLFEQDIMASEDRAWWMARLKKMHEEQKQQSNMAATPSIPKPNIPTPNIPH